MDTEDCCFLSRYAGELISDAEADKREDDSYLFDLDNEVIIAKDKSRTLKLAGTRQSVSHSLTPKTSNIDVI